jgi:hypothetical protein
LDYPKSTTEYRLGETRPGSDQPFPGPLLAGLSPSPPLSFGEAIQGRVSRQARAGREIHFWITNITNLRDVIVRGLNYWFTCCAPGVGIYIIRDWLSIPSLACRRADRIYPSDGLCILAVAWDMLYEALYYPFLHLCLWLPDAMYPGAALRLFALSRNLTGIAFRVAPDPRMLGH